MAHKKIKRMKTKKKEIQFDYFQVYCYEIDKENNLAKEMRYDLTGILEKALSLKPKETMRPYREEQARIQCVKRHEKENLWELQLLRLREVSAPGLANDEGEYTLYKLEDGEYVGESTTLLYDEINTVLVMQRNGFGFTPTGVEEYLNSVIQGEDLIFLKPIISGTDINKITKDKIYRKISFGVVAHEIKGIDKDSSLYSLLSNFLKYSGKQINIEISLGHAKKTEKLDEIMAYDTIKELYGKNFTNKLKATIKDSPDTKVEELDLLDDRRKDYKTFRFNKQNPLEHNTIFNELKKKYLNRKDKEKIF